MAVKLTVTPPGAGPGAPEFSYTFDQEKIVVGRGASADVLLPSASVSDTHCVIRLEGQDYVIFDPGSTNGTRHNGQPLVEGRRKLLRSGDVIEVMGFQICFRAGLAMEGIHTAERTAALARRMVREALDTLGPGGEPPHLTFLNGSRAGDRVAIPDHPEGLTVGREVDCDVRLDDSDSSRRQAVVRRSWEGTFVTDVGSTKAAIVGTLEPWCARRGLAFVGAHPLAGSDRQGLDAAQPDLFDGSLCVLARTPRTDRRALARVQRLWRPLVGRLLALPPAAHDRLLADASHLPHVVAFALVASADPRALAIAPRSFLDATRVAKSDPGLWRDILLSNRTSVRRSLAGLRRRLSAVDRWLSRREAAALTQLGDIESETGHLGAAREAYVDARAIYARDGDQRDQAGILVRLGMLAHRQGHGDEAISCYESARELYDSASDHSGLGHVAKRLGHLEREAGRQDKALDRYREALTQYRRAHDTLGEANALKSLGGLYRSLGQLDRARADYERAAELFAEAGDLLGQAAAALALGRVLTETGETSEARVALEKSHHLYASAGSLRGEGEALLDLGRLSGSRHQLERAADLFGRSGATELKEEAIREAVRLG